MEEIALAVLPRETEDVSEGSSFATDLPFHDQWRGSTPGTELPTFLFDPNVQSLDQLDKSWSDGPQTDSLTVSLDWEPMRESDENEIFPIKCICANNVRNSQIVFCERCGKWQHIECYYDPSQKRLDHNCVDCVPREIEALGRPPTWLTAALSTLSTSYPHDLFQARMRHFAVSTHQPPSLEPKARTLPAIEFQYLPRIRCFDCPGKLYTPGPGMGVENFEVHLQNRAHRDNVERRVSGKNITPVVAEKNEMEMEKHIVADKNSNVRERTTRQPDVTVFSERLQAANNNHRLAAGLQSSATTISDERSPFRQGSPFAPESYWKPSPPAPRLGSATPTRERQKAEAEAKTISPGEILIDDSET